MASQEFINMRMTLGKSQGSLANLLGLSIRSVQAYEQGWREVPPEVERWLLYLVYQKRQGRSLAKLCWEIKNCPNEWREHCSARESQAQGPCWFLNGNFCERGKIARTGTKSSKPAKPSRLHTRYGGVRRDFWGMNCEPVMFPAKGGVKVRHVAG